jgi:protein-disulfide isomerase
MKTLPVTALASAAAIGAGWVMNAGSGGYPGPLPAAAEAQEAAADGAGAGGEANVEEMTLGDPEAPVQVIEYASFTCPHCASFNETVWPVIKENYVDTGKIGFTYREVYFDRYGLWAGMLARCAGDTQKYFAISDLIYERQRDWTQGAPAEIAESLRKIGRTAGLGEEQIDACMADGAKAEALVAEFEANAEADGIESTPSFIIDGQKYSNMSYEEFAGILDGQLAEDES